jgi:hypothetical protein
MSVQLGLSAWSELPLADFDKHPELMTRGPAKQARD